MPTAVNKTFATAGTALWGRGMPISITSGKVPIAFSVAVVPDRDIEQAYFWTSTWQAWEKEADEDLKAGRYAEFEDIDSLLKDLHTPEPDEK